MRTDDQLLELLFGPALWVELSLPHKLNRFLCCPSRFSRRPKESLTSAAATINTTPNKEKNDPKNYYAATQAPSDCVPHLYD